MKKVGRCDSCGRNLYTNEYNMCKRCWQEVGVDFLSELAEPEEPLE